MRISRALYIQRTTPYAHAVRPAVTYFVIFHTVSGRDGVSEVYFRRTGRRRRHPRPQGGGWGWGNSLSHGRRGGVDLTRPDPAAKSDNN